MSAIEERQRRRHAEDVALARRYASITREPKTIGPWIVSARSAAGIAWSARSVEGNLRITVAHVSGAGDVGRVLGSRYCLEWLDSNSERDLAGLNRHLLEHPLSDEWLIAVGCLVISDGEWSGSFAGVPLPQFGDAIPNSGIGPFLGLANATFPSVRGERENDGTVRWLISTETGSEGSMEIRRRNR